MRVPSDASGLEIAGNPNVLSRDVGTSRLAQAASALSVPVGVERFAGDPPAPRSYALPAMTGGDGML